VELFHCKDCKYRLKCELTGYKEQMLKKYKRSLYFRRVKGVVEKPTLTPFEKGLQLGYLFDVQYDWQHAYLRNVISDLSNCLDIYNKKG